MKIIFEPGDVEIRDVPTMPVAMIEHRGSRDTIPETRNRFIAWRKAAGLSPETNATYMVFRSEREPANPDDYRMDLCIGLDRPLEADDGVVRASEIPGGRHAVLRYPGNTNNLEPAALYLYRDWLPSSGDEAGDFPIYSKRWLAPVPGVGAQEVVVEIFLPLK